MPSPTPVSTPKPTPEPTPEPTSEPPLFVDQEGNFELYGKVFNLDDESMDLRKIPIDDNGDLLEAMLPYMSRLKVLDMDSCGIDNRRMEEIRDKHPEIEVIWRVFFGSNYTARTDVEKILASCPGGGGNLTPENYADLKYCTKLKYLDIGHNEELHDISVVQYMPDLEVLIVAMDYFEDLSPVESCPHLEFLEIQTNHIADLSPLSNLKELKHLNIANNPELSDISPLFGLTQLERLWIGCIDPVPQEQIDEMQKLAPDCYINSTTYDPHLGEWRYKKEGGFTDRFALLVEQFGYDKADYAYPWKDPLFSADPSPSEHMMYTLPQGEEIADSARRFEGSKYVYGEESPEKGFDCSGLVYYVYLEHGYELYRTADGMHNNGIEVKPENMQPGDVLLFKRGGSIYHAGIYLGDGMFIHAQDEAHGVVITPLQDYSDRGLEIRRIVTAQ